MTDPSHRILNSLSASTQQWAARREALGPELWDDELREALRDGVHSAENLAAAEGVQSGDDAVPVAEAALVVVAA